MELSKLVYLAVAALAAGIVMFFASSKERNEKGEWGNGLQWAYLLMMIGVFGILALWVEWSLTAVLLAFTVFTGAVWLWAKLARGKGQPEKAALPDSNHFRDYMGGFFPIILVVFLLRTFVAEPFNIPSSSMRPGLVKGDFVLVSKFSYGVRMPILNNVLIPTGKIEHGDVVVFNYPVEPKTNFIKRIVGLPGDTVEYKDKVLKVNGNIVETDTPDGSYAYPDDNDPQQQIDTQRYHADFAGRRFDVLKKEGEAAVKGDGVAYYQNLAAQNGIEGQADEQNQNCVYEADDSGFTCTVPAGKYFAMGDNRDHSADSRYWGFIDDSLIVGKAFFIWLNFSEPSRIGTVIK